MNNLCLYNLYILFHPNFVVIFYESLMCLLIKYLLVKKRRRQPEGTRVEGEGGGGDIFCILALFVWFLKT